MVWPPLIKDNMGSEIFSDKDCTGFPTKEKSPTSNSTLILAIPNPFLSPHVFLIIPINIIPVQENDNVNTNFVYPSEIIESSYSKEVLPIGDFYPLNETTGADKMGFP